MVLRSVHTTVTEVYQLPYCVSYVGFAVATILMGTGYCGVLGLMLVCCIDCVCPPQASVFSNRLIIGQIDIV